MNAHKSGMPTIPGAVLWHLTLTVPDERTADAAAAALETASSAVSAFEIAPSGAWRVEAYADREPDRAALDGAGALAALAHGVAGEGLFADLMVERLTPRDWVAENQQSFPPLRVGRFFIHGSHITGAVPAGAIGLCIDAATAFGTGEHATTRGCLLALDRLAKRGRRRHPLDMGTGTGVLAMAAAKRWNCAVLACDIDAGSVEVARTNMRANGVTRRVRLYRSNGYRHPAVRRGRPFDLVLANILARPLARMAGDLAAHLGSGGVAVLSGLLTRQAPLVLAAHRSHGLTLRCRIVIAGWETLVLEGRAAAG
jgi:ribosomal protein L11 methyltransferase